MPPCWSRYSGVAPLKPLTPHPVPLPTGERIKVRGQPLASSEFSKFQCRKIFRGDTPLKPLPPTFILPLEGEGGGEYL